MNVFLNEVCDHIKNNYTIENNLLNSEIIRTLIREETLKTLWRHYLEGNNLEFCHMAIPLIESIFRYTLEKI